jgi:hypothetical protein
MKKAFVALFILLSVCAAALAEGKEEPFLQLAKGNYWKYDVVERGEKSSGKMEVEEMTEDGTAKVKASEMADFPQTINWKMTKEYLVWEIAEMGMSFKWNMLKLGAKKDDSWTTDFTPDIDIPDGPTPEEMKMTINSTVVGTEDVSTPAGTFKGCLKVKHVTPGPNENLFMWWAKGVGLVKLLVEGESGQVDTSWTLTEYKAGPDITDKQLKDMVEKAEIVAIVHIDKEALGEEDVQVSLRGTYKGDPKAADGKIVIVQPEKGSKTEALEEGDYVVFLKKDGEKLVLASAAVKSQKDFVARLDKLLKPESGDEKLRELCEKAEMVIVGEVVKLEDRGTYKYYVVKVTSGLKGAEEGKHLDVLCPQGVTLTEGQKYVMFLAGTEETGRKMVRPVDVVRGIVEHDEDVVKKLKEVISGSK